MVDFSLRKIQKISRVVSYFIISAGIQCIMANLHRGFARYALAGRWKVCLVVHAYYFFFIFYSFLNSI
jgi:hypothetical protein